MKSLFKVYCSFALLAISSGANASVWDDQNTWSIDWEAKYGQWVAHEFKADAFSLRPGNLLATPVSSVDLPFLVKAVFAYKNQLPFVIPSRANSRSLVSNRSASWDNIPPGDERFAQ